MKHGLQLLLIFAVGMAGGLLGASFLDSGQPDGAASGATETAALDPRVLKALEERVMLLESEAESQRLAIEDFGAQLVAATRRAAPPEAAAAALSGEGPEPGLLALADLPTGPGFDAAVDAAIARREEQQRAEREAERAQRREERVQRTVDQLAQELGLEEGQQRTLAGAMLEAQAAREAIFETMRESGGFDRDSARQQMTAIREAELAKAGSVLSAEQLKRYGEVTELGRDFGRGGGGPGGGGQTGRAGGSSDGGF